MLNYTLETKLKAIFYLSSCKPNFTNLHQPRDLAPRLPGGEAIIAILKISVVVGAVLLLT